MLSSDPNRALRKVIISTGGLTCKVSSILVNAALLVMELNWVRTVEFLIKFQYAFFNILEAFFFPIKWSVGIVQIF